MAEVLNPFKELSETEKEIMEYLWSEEKQGKILCFAEILSYFNEEKDKNWKKQTLSVFLARLGEKEMVFSQKKGRTYEYAPVSEKDYEKRKANGLLQGHFSGNMEKFLLAFYGGEAITHKEKENLKSWLDALEEVD